MECTESSVLQQSIANVQCAALPGGSPAECAQPIQPLAPLVATLQSTTPPPTVCKCVWARILNQAKYLCLLFST